MYVPQKSSCRHKTESAHEGTGNHYRLTFSAPLTLHCTELLMVHRSSTLYAQKPSSHITQDYVEKCRLNGGSTHIATHTSQTQYARWTGHNEKMLKFFVTKKKIHPLLKLVEVMGHHTGRPP